MTVLLILCCSPLTVGCSGYRQPPVVERDTEGSPEQIRKDLEIIAESGTGESALQPIVIGMQALDPAYPGKADLEAASKKLMAAGSPDQRKEIAREMIQIIDQQPK